MIAINKDEKDAILERFPDVYIVRTMKQKSKRHHYYCEELKSIMRFLRELRGAGTTNKKVGADSEFRKKAR